MRTTLPDSDFRTIAGDLWLYAQREAMGLTQLEVFVARLPEPSIALTRTVETTKRAAADAGQLAALFVALADHEPEVRALLEEILARGPKVVGLPQRVTTGDEVAGLRRQAGAR